MAGGATKHLRGAAAAAHKEKEAKMSEAEHGAAAPKRRGRPPGSGKKKSGKAAAKEEEEEEGAGVEEEEPEFEHAVKKPRDIAKKMKAMIAQPRPEGMNYWCLKDKPGPTRLVGGPSMAASELCDMVSNMGTFTWDGVRDEASNAFLRKMRAGDTACLFHGGTSDRAVVGVMEVMSDPRPDPSAWDPDSPFYDASSPESKPKWHCVDVQLKNAFPRYITLAELNMHDKDMPEHNELISQPRLCIFPAPKDEWDILMSMPEQPPPANLPMPATPAAR